MRCGSFLGAKGAASVWIWRWTLYLALCAVPPGWAQATCSMEPAASQDGLAADFKSRVNLECKDHEGRDAYAVIVSSCGSASVQRPETGPGLGHATQMFDMTCPGPVDITVEF